MLRPPDPRVRSRILNYGSEGCGKSTAWLKIAQWAADTGSDAQFYVLDTDDSAETMMVMGNYPEDNIHVWQATDWADYKKFANDVVGQVRPKHDWIIVDFASTAWAAVQDWYIENTYGQSQADYFMSVRQSGGKELEGWTDWKYINKEYRSWINPVVYGNGAHVYFTAQATRVGDRDDRKVKALYSNLGQRPEGQKALGFQVHSVLWSNALRAEEVYMTTVKDLEGVKRMESMLFKDFVIDYMVGCAGWQL